MFCDIIFSEVSHNNATLFLLFVNLFLIKITSEPDFLKTISTTTQKYLSIRFQNFHLAMDAKHLGT